MRLKYSEEAKLDLEIIAYDGKIKFGETRARIYLRAIQETIDVVLSFPEIGKVPFPEEAPEIRSILSGVHLIFYEITQNAVLINAIIHARSNTQEVIASIRHEKTIK